MTALSRKQPWGQKYLGKITKRCSFSRAPEGLQKVQSLGLIAHANHHPGQQLFAESVICSRWTGQEMTFKSKIHKPFIDSLFCHQLLILPLPHSLLSAQIWPLTQLSFHSVSPALLFHFPATFAIFPDVQLNIKWFDRQNRHSPNHLFPINIHVEFLLTSRSYAHKCKWEWPFKWSLHLKVWQITFSSILTSNHIFHAAHPQQGCFCKIITFDMISIVHFCN